MNDIRKHLSWTYDSKLYLSEESIKDISERIDETLQHYLKYPDIFSIKLMVNRESVDFIFNILQRPDNENLVSMVDTMSGYYATSTKCRTIKNEIATILQRPFTFSVKVIDSKMGEVINLKGLY